MQSIVFAPSVLPKLTFSRRTKGRSSSSARRSAIAFLGSTLLVAASACTKPPLPPPPPPPPTVTVLGISPNMPCDQVVEAIFPLHQNVKPIMEKSVIGSFKSARTFLTRASMKDWCDSGYGVGRSVEDTQLYVATQSGTVAELTFQPGGFQITVEPWLKMSFSDVSFSMIFRGKVYRSDIDKDFDTVLKSAEDEVVGATLQSLGAPLVSARWCSSCDAEPFWRRGDYMVSPRRGGLLVLPVRPFVEGPLKNSPDVELVLDALRKNGVKDL